MPAFAQYKNKVLQKYSEYRAHEHSKLLLGAIGLLIVSTLLMGGAMKSSAVKLRGVAPSRLVEAKLQELMKADIFSDVSSTHEHAHAIAYLKSLGLIEGYQDGTFKPNESITRAEFVIFLTKALRANPHNLRHSYCFQDVTNEWFAPATCFAKSKGWLLEQELFQPAEKTTKATALKAVLEAFEVEFSGPGSSAITADAWYAHYYWTAEAKGWVHSSDFKPEDAITRGELARLIYIVMMSEMLPF